MARGGFPGGMGGQNMNALMRQAQKMQRDMEKAQEELEVFSKALEDIMNASVKVFTEQDTKLARMIEPIEETIEEFIQLLIEEPPLFAEFFSKRQFLIFNLLFNYSQVFDY